MKWCLTVVLICISLMVNDVEHLFIYLLVICISSLEKCLSFVYFKIGMCAFWLLSCKCSLYILGTRSLSDIRFANIFIHSVGCFFFIFLIVPLQHRSFQFWSSPIYLLFLLLFVIFSVISRKPLPNPRSQRFTSMVSSRSCIVLALMFVSDWFKVIFLYDVR